MLLGSGPFPGAVFVLPAVVLGVLATAVAVAVAVDCSAAAAVGVLAAAAAAGGTPDNAESVFRTDVRSGSISVPRKYDLSVLW